jgi:hypothetical protein
MAQLLLAQGRCLDSGAKADFHYTSRRAPGQVVLSQVGLPAPARTGCCQHGWLAHRQRMPSSLRYRRATGASPSARTRSQFSITLAGHRVPWLIDPHTRGTIDRTRRGPSPTTWTVPIELRARSRVPVLFPEKKHRASGATSPHNGMAPPLAQRAQGRGDASPPSACCGAGGAYQTVIPCVWPIPAGMRRPRTASSIRSRATHQIQVTPLSWRLIPHWYWSRG